MSLGRPCGSLDKASIEFWLQDHDSDVVDEQPPVQNQWYPAFHAEDVRLIWCVVQQNNDETVNKDVEVRWTIDGNVYTSTTSLPDSTDYWVHRGHEAAGGTYDLRFDTSRKNAGYNVDKRGLDFKVEVRQTAALGTNQRLRCWCVRETSEAT